MTQLLITEKQFGIGAIICMFLLGYIVYKILNAISIPENTEIKNEIISEDEFDLTKSTTEPKGIATLTEHINSVVNPKSEKKTYKRIKQRYNKKHSKE